MKLEKKDFIYFNTQSVDVLEAQNGRKCRAVILNIASSPNLFGPKQRI